MQLESINAVTLLTADMGRAVDFYTSLGFRVLYGGHDAPFTSCQVGDGFLNLALHPGYTLGAIWGRAIIHVSDVDAMYDRAVKAGYEPEAPPRDAEWGERYFHIQDPDGHELSFARRLSRS